MHKALLITGSSILAGSITLLPGCSTETTREAAPVTIHTSMNKSLDDCDRLGQVSIEYETKSGLSRRQNAIQSQERMKHKAYDQYRANNLVIIHTQYTQGGYREKDMMSSRGIAYLCE